MKNLTFLDFFAGIGTIRRAGIAIPDDGDVTVKRLPGEIYLGATYEVEIE